MDLITCFPYDDALSRFSIPGSKLRQIFAHIMRTENRTSEGECYQVNGKVRAVYNDKTHQLESLKIDSQEVDNTKFYTICMQNYHFKQSAAYLNITNKELLESGQHKVVTTSARQVLEEWLRNHQNTSREVEGRMKYRK